jgi:integrase/recombinase XerD
VDVDLDRRVLHVVESKGKSRFVPFRTDLARDLQDYREQRDRRAAVAAEAPFFVRADGRAFTVKRISDVLRAALRRLGLKPAAGRVGPRPYDLRHAFAVHRLSRWLRDGIDVHGRLPWLSAYMGHDDLLGTETYLTATPELLELASRRLRRRLRAAEPR